jgi:hypothetical protein
MDLCSEEQSKECNNQATHNSLQERKLGLCAVLNFQEFLSDEEKAIGLPDLPKEVNQRAVI